jgi:hypothetical protein
MHHIGDKLTGVSCCHITKCIALDPPIALLCRSMVRSVIEKMNNSLLASSSDELKSVIMSVVQVIHLAF